MPGFDEAAGIVAPAASRPDLCSGKHGGNAESAAAFAKLEPHIRDIHATILRLASDAGSGGVTVKEVAEALGRPINAISGRLSELRSDRYCRQVLGQAGALLIPSGAKRMACTVLIVRM